MIPTTKKETEDKILEYHAAGINSVRIAKAMGLTCEYVRSVIKLAQYAEREAADFVKEWDRARFIIREAVEKERAAEEKREEMRKRVVYHRVTAGSGYWWERGTDSGCTDNSGET